MNRTVERFKFAMPALALGAVLTLLGPTAALAQRGGGRGGRSGGSYSGRSFSGGGGRSYSPPTRAAAIPAVAQLCRPLRGPQLFRRWAQLRRPLRGRSYYGGGGGYYPGRFYAGRGYYYGGRFWARPYFGVGIGIPYGSGPGCGYYDGYGIGGRLPAIPIRTTTRATDRIVARQRGTAGTRPSRCRCAPAGGHRPVPDGSRSCPATPGSVQSP